MTSSLDLDVDDGLLRIKYQQAMQELDHTKRRLMEQHETDLEQTMVLKKMLEKKVSYTDAVGIQNIF